MTEPKAKDVKKLNPTPNNNKEQGKKEEPKEVKEKALGPEVPQPQPKSFTITTEGVNELVTCLNEVVASKYVKQVIFNVINENFKPVF